MTEEIEKRLDDLVFAVKDVVRETESISAEATGWTPNLEQIAETLEQISQHLDRLTAESEKQTTLLQHLWDDARSR